MGVAYTEDALAGLRQVQRKKIRQQIVKKVDALAGDAHPKGAKRVQGMSDRHRTVYRIRCGDHRVLYCQNEDSEILVIDIGHRKDVYRNR